MSMRTPLKSVRHLGSAKEGADHFWMQRLTGIANIFLGLFLVWVLAQLAGASHTDVKDMIAQPLVALALVVLFVSTAIHMRLGLQVVIEDYITHDMAKLLLLILNNFIAIGVGAVAVFSVLKLAFGG